MMKVLVYQDVIVNNNHSVRLLLLPLIALRGQIKCFEFEFEFELPHRETLHHTTAYMT